MFRKYIGELDIKDIGYNKIFIIEESKKDWFDSIVSKYEDLEIKIFDDYGNGWDFTIGDISEYINWKEINDITYSDMKGVIKNYFPFEKYLLDNNISLSKNDKLIAKVWKVVDGKILKLEEGTQDKVLDLFIKLEYKLDIDDNDGFVESSEYKGNFIENGFKAIEMCGQYPYLSDMEAEEYNSCDIITYEDLKNICIENNII